MDNGYSFNGWKYGSTNITSSTTVSTASDHTLTAQWTELPAGITVKYVSRGSDSTTVGSSATSLNKTLTVTSNTNMTFNTSGITSIGTATCSNSSCTGLAWAIDQTFSYSTTNAKSVAVYYNDVFNFSSFSAASNSMSLAENTSKAMYGAGLRIIKIVATNYANHTTTVNIYMAIN